MRAGSGESQNRGTRPPDPPEGGHPVRVEITEAFTSSRGRRRVRRVHADPGELVPLADEDRAVWSATRERLRGVAGTSMFEIWLAAVEPIGVSGNDGALLLAANADSHAWIASRYRHALDALSVECGRVVRMASDRELALHRACASTASMSPGLSLIDDHRNPASSIASTSPQRVPWRSCHITRISNTPTSRSPPSIYAGSTTPRSFTRSTNGPRR